MASLGPAGCGVGPYLRRVCLARRVYELVPAIPGTIRPQHHATLSGDRQCDSSLRLRQCCPCYQYVLRRCLLDRSVGYPGLQWPMASLGGNQRPGLLSGVGYGTGFISPAYGLWLRSLSSIRFCIDWKRRCGLAGWRIVSLVVSDLPRSGQKCRLIRGAWNGGSGLGGPGCARR